MKKLFFLLPLSFLLLVACSKHEETVVQKAVKRAIPASQDAQGEENAPKSMKELTATDATTEVEKVDLKSAWEVKGSQKAVFLSHKNHAEKYTKGNCDTCHSSKEGGDKIGEKLKDGIKGSGASNSAHAFCWNCHNAQPKTAKTPGKTCAKCHSGK